MTLNFFLLDLNSWQAGCFHPHCRDLFSELWRTEPLKSSPQVFKRIQNSWFSKVNVNQSHKEQCLNRLLSLNSWVSDLMGPVLRQKICMSSKITSDTWKKRTIALRQTFCDQALSSVLWMSYLESRTLNDMQYSDKNLGFLFIGQGFLLTEFSTFI